MKSYLSLIPISARVRRKQNKMTITCIVLAVFLVTAIFSLADAVEKVQLAESVDKAGYWHIKLRGLEESDAAMIASRPDVVASSWYDVINLDENLNMDKDYDIKGAQTALCGIEESFIADIMYYFSDGAHIGNKNEVVLTENARELLGVEAGDAVTLNTPAGSHDFIVSGFRITGNGKYVSANGGVTSALLVKDHQVGAFMDMNAFRRICLENGETSAPQYYVQFSKRANLKKAIAEIKEQYGLADSDIDFNTILMASKGISNKSYLNGFYFLAQVFIFLVLLAGVMMISSSMNSSVAQRMQFFGMLRCIGASKSQIIRFVRLEALNWCKTAIPIGVSLGVASAWILSAGMKYIAGGELASLPVFTVSIGGILYGAAIGIVTVMLAAQVPAKRASKASPIAAASGNAGEKQCQNHVANAHIVKVESALGIHHAVSAKKNLFLMTGSFALTIILFFCFSVLVELVGCIVPQKASSPDIDISSMDLSNSIDAALVREIEEIDGVSHAFGRRMCADVLAEMDGGMAEEIDFLSYDNYQLDLLAKDRDLRKGSDVTKLYGDNNYVLAIWDRDMPLKIGDKIHVAGEELEIVGLLKYNPFSNDGSINGKITIIASGQTFIRLTGIVDYATIDVQLGQVSEREGDEAAAQIRKLSKGHNFRDRRDEDTKGTFYMMNICIYGFIGITALIALLNIMNSISMGVSARINQYGAMRAIGMSAGQLAKMVAVEAFAYAIFGCVAGCAIGLPLSKYMYDHLVTAHFYYFTWSVPIMQIVIVLLFVLTAALVAVYAPSKRIRDMSIVDTIHAQ